jgi:hypothetical protein
MKSSNIFISLAFSLLWLALKTKVCYAFKIAPVITRDSEYLNSNSYCDPDNGSIQLYCSSYSIQKAGQGTLAIEASRLKWIEPKSDSPILQVLNNSPWATTAGPKWSFESSKKSLAGTLEIAKYKPIVSYNNIVKGFTPGEDPDVTPNIPSSGYIGGYLRAEFLPAGTDPQPSSPTNKLHWIQAISSNHGGVIYGFNPSKNNINYGVIDVNKIDVIEEQKDTAWIQNPSPIYGNLFNPYYDGYYGYGLRLDFPAKFLDLPSRVNSIEKPNNWTAQLYLAEEYEPNKVRIYDGIEWGWSSSFTKELQAALPADIPSSGSPTSPKRPSYACGRGWPISCCTPWGLDYSTSGVVSKGTLSLDPEFQDNSIYENNATTDPTAVPTPALLPTLATAGIYHGRKWRKRKQAQKDNDIAA